MQRRDVGNVKELKKKMKEERINRRFAKDLKRIYDELRQGLPRDTLVQEVRLFMCLCALVVAHRIENYFRSYLP